MQLKDKLELLWKYLILLIFVIIAFSHLFRGKYAHHGKGHPYYLGGNKVVGNIEVVMNFS